MPFGLWKAVWAGLFILCATVGFLPADETALAVVYTAFAVLFFLPPGLLIKKAWGEKNEKELRFVKVLSLVSLGTTFGLMIANLLSVLAPIWVGDVLNALLVILGTPMMCSRVPLLTLLLWAVLFFTARELLNILKKEGCA